MTKIILCGAAGRMGTRIIALSKDSKHITLSACVETPSNPSKVTGGIACADSLQHVIHTGEVVIDFTSPESTLTNLAICLGSKKPIVIGTTGFTDEQRSEIQNFSKLIPIVFSSNMSVGVNVMWKIIAEATKALGSSYDIEVLEMHHRLKKDAPSGTAMTTAEVLAEASGRNLSKDAIYARHGMIGERKANEIGIQTLRGGDVVGDHTVYFAGIGERLEITHRATSRDTFAQGALRAAEWLLGKKPGLYDMQDVLGLK